MHWANIFVGIGGGAAGAGTVGVVVRHFIKSLIQDVVNAAIDAFKKDVDKALGDVNGNVQGLAVKLAAETGGNSNGLREKLDTVGSEVSTVATGVAELRGAFNQHVAQHGTPVNVTVGQPVAQHPVAAPLPPALP